jgi:hypothetical protein
MTRSVVFKTKGKLDLRSIMTFGLNAKPNTGHPIGFFGTGLKYAIAVLTRNKIPVTFYIDGMKWTVETEDSKFRDKSVTEVFLLRNRGKFLPSHIKKLPFTTELGKTWELWQAFRELYSNTLDEKGEAYVTEDSDLKAAFNYLHDTKGHTCICVESEAFVQEFFGKDKTFLPDGLILREGSEAVQIFDRPSRHIYYRGIRVLDLKEKEYSELTYNILSPIELTEDRTAKSKFDVQWIVSKAIAATEDKMLIQTAVKAATKSESFERGLNYSWGTPSTAFLDAVEEIPERERDSSSQAALNSYRPKPVKATTKKDWIEPIIKAVERGDWGALETHVQLYREEFVKILREAQEKLNATDDLSLPSLHVSSLGDGEGDAEGVRPESGDQTKAHSNAQTEDDEIPF